MIDASQKTCGAFGYGFVKNHPKKTALCALTILVISILLASTPFIVPYLRPLSPSLNLSFEAKAILFSIGVMGALLSLPLLIFTLFKYPRPSTLEKIPNSLDPHDSKHKKSEPIEEGILKAFFEKKLPQYADFNGWTLTESKKAHAENIDWNKPVFKGGNHLCFLTNLASSKLFKIKKIEGFFTPGEKEYCEYEAAANEARKVCLDENLYLFYIPLCKFIKIKDQLCILQEKIAFLGKGDYLSQKELFDEYIHKYPDYMKELCRQMMILVAILKFSDVKYDNLPIMADGRLGLFDLDKKSALAGFLGGSALAPSGLIHIFPKEWILQFLPEVEKHLSKSDYLAIQEALK